MTESADRINREIFGYTNVISLALTNDESDEFRGYDLCLTLESMQNRRIELTCIRVSNLRIEKFGQGINQFMGLHAIDVRAQQLERVALNFVDRENRRITFDCSAAEVKQLA